MPKKDYSVLSALVMHQFKEAGIELTFKRIHETSGEPTRNDLEEVLTELQEDKKLSAVYRLYSPAKPQECIGEFKHLSEIPEYMLIDVDSQSQEMFQPLVEHLSVIFSKPG